MNPKTKLYKGLTLINMLCVACSLIVPVQEAEARKRRRVIRGTVFKKAGDGINKAGKEIVDGISVFKGDEPAGKFFTGQWGNKNEPEEEKSKEEDYKANPNADMECLEIWRELQIEYNNHDESYSELEKDYPACAAFWYSPMQKGYRDDVKSDLNCQDTWGDILKDYKDSYERYYVLETQSPECALFWFGPPPMGYDEWLEAQEENDKFVKDRDRRNSAFYRESSASVAIDECSIRFSRLVDRGLDEKEIFETLPARCQYYWWEDNVGGIDKSWAIKPDPLLSEKKVEKERTSCEDNFEEELNALIYEEQMKEYFYGEEQDRSFDNIERRAYQRLSGNCKYYIREWYGDVIDEDYDSEKTAKAASTKQAKNNRNKKAKKAKDSVSQSNATKQITLYGGYYDHYGNYYDDYFSWYDEWIIQEAALDRMKQMTEEEMNGYDYEYEAELIKSEVEKYMK